MNPWPSERVAAGGLFHLPKVKYSKETHDLIKLLMEEQKMSILQRSRIENYLKDGMPLPKPHPLRLRTTKCRPNVDFFRSRTAKRRSLDAIKASGALDEERYRPKPICRLPCEKQKLLLQAKISGVATVDEDDIDVNSLEKAKKAPEPEPIDPIDELLEEINERAEWLNEMEALGQAKQHKTIILNQIAERMRMIKKIERERESNQE